MEEQLPVSNFFGDWLESFGFTLSLYLKDTDPSDIFISAIVIDSFLSVHAVSSDEVIFRITVFQEAHLDSHAAVNVLHGIDRILSVQCSKKNTRSVLDVD